MPLFIRKQTEPKPIEAVQFVAELPFQDYIHVNESMQHYVKTASGERAFLKFGDWILPEPNGDGHYPCSDEVFRATYEEVSEPAKSPFAPVLARDVAEFEALVANIQKLETFVKSPAGQMIGEEMRILLVYQLEAMSRYAGYLGARIDILKQDPKLNTAVKPDVTALTEAELQKALADVPWGAAPALSDEEKAWNRAVQAENSRRMRARHVTTLSDRALDQALAEYLGARLLKPSDEERAYIEALTAEVIRRKRGEPLPPKKTLTETQAIDVATIMVGGRV